MKIQGKQADISEAISSLPAEAQHLLKASLSNQDHGYLPASEVNRILKESGLTLQNLMNYCVVVAQLYAQPPISNYKVGAVVHGISGALYFGANIEFVSQALSFCVHAEQAAIAHAISYGELGVDYLAISAAPCGYCRQFLYEITNCKTTPDIQVLIKDKTSMLSTLLPQAFGPKDLNVTTRLMQPQDNKLKLSPQPVDPIIIAALRSANNSYSPYSSDFSGISLATSRDIYVGAYAENAAYNPSMSPLEASLISLIMSGDTFIDIRRAVLVEAANSKVSQLSATTNVLASIAPAVKLERYLASVVK